MLIIEDEKARTILQAFRLKSGNVKITTKKDYYDDFRDVDVSLDASQVEYLIKALTAWLKKANNLKSPETEN